MEDQITGQLNRIGQTLNSVTPVDIQRLVFQMRNLKGCKGRLFFIGNGGGAGHASHAAADFRKIARIESYAWGENVSDMTAYINDYDWERSTEYWLRDSRINSNDMLWVFSVGGGSKDTSSNLVRAMQHCAYEGIGITGIVGSGGAFEGYSEYGINLHCNSTPIVEGLQAVLWHMIVSLV